MQEKFQAALERMINVENMLSNVLSSFFFQLRAAIYYQMFKLLNQGEEN